MSNSKKEMPKVGVWHIEDGIPKSYQDVLENTLTSKNFLWSRSNKTAIPTEDGRGVIFDKNTLDEGQMVHSFFGYDQEQENHSEYFNLVKPVMYFIEAVDTPHIVRIKANMLTKNSNWPEGKHNPIHTDISLEDDEERAKFMTALYYVNDSDGDTLFFDRSYRGEEVEDDNNLKIFARYKPKKGTLLVFNSELYHASTPPKEHDTRIVISFVFMRELVDVQNNELQKGE